MDSPTKQDQTAKSLITKFKPYFRYALELKRLAPIIAYYCELYAINKGLETIKNLNEDYVSKNMIQVTMLKKFLNAQMNELGKMKNVIEKVKKEDLKY